MSRRTPRYTQHRRGALLLVVVACIVLASLAMVGVTRQSLRLATRSIESETELQQRWGTISLQRTLLHSAPQIFAELDKRSMVSDEPGPFPNTVRSEVLLGGIKFDALLADEQTKLNLNLAYQTRGKTTVEQLVREQLGPSGLRVQLSPEVASTTRGIASWSGAPTTTPRVDNEIDVSSTPPAFRHWGQVFDLSNAAGSLPANQLLPAATLRLTCWGRGEVNIARAPDEIVKETCRPALGPGVATKLIRRYRDNPTLNVKQIAMQLEVKDQELRELGRLITTQSSTYSLWLSSTSLNGTQRWFAVAASQDVGDITTERFQF